MKEKRLRLLYMGNAAPPGTPGETASTAAPFLTYQYEARLVEGLRRLVDVSTVGLLSKQVWNLLRQPKDNAPGMDHELVLWNRAPILWHHWIARHKLRRYYLDKVQRGEKPDILIVRNLQHVFNDFVKWLRTQSDCPLIVLLLGDSGGLGEKIPALRRFRYKFKPMQMMEDKAVKLYDACLGSGLKSRRYFEEQGIPWMWMPCGFLYDYNPPPPDPNETGPIRFGYFGALTERSGVRTLVKAFVSTNPPGTLHICGHGELCEELKQMRYPNVHFDGFLPKQSDCMPWAQKVDVLINLRLPYWGQENSAPSKVFEYGLAGRAILSTRTAGMDELLGEEGMYLDTENYEDSLREKLKEISAMERKELQRRAKIIHDRIVNNYSWEEQARRSVEFLSQIMKTRPSNKVMPPG